MVGVLLVACDGEKTESTPGHSDWSLTKRNGMILDINEYLDS